MYEPAMGWEHPSYWLDEEEDEPADEDCICEPSDEYVYDGEECEWESRY